MKELKACKTTQIEPAVQLRGLDDRATAVGEELAASTPDAAVASIADSAFFLFDFSAENRFNQMIETGNFIGLGFVERGKRGKGKNEKEKKKKEKQKRKKKDKKENRLR